MKFALPFKKQIPKKQWHLLAICIIIIGILAVNAIIRYAIGAFSGLENDISIAQKRLGRLHSVVSQRKEIESRYKEIISGLQQIKDSDDFIQAIENSAKEVGLSISNVKPTATRVEDLYKIYSVKIDAADQVSTLAQFLYLVSEGFNGIGVGSLQINSKNKRQLPRLNLLISAVAFKE